MAEPTRDPAVPQRDVLDIARELLAAEADAVRGLVDLVDERFVAAVELLLAAPGRVIVTGMGKSGLVGAKMAATFCSTGTPAFFLHPGEALHGDLGLVTREDAVVAVSRSGRTTELAQLLPLLERLGTPIVALVSDTNSPLARAARIVLPLGRFREAGPGDLVPTSSTTAAMALGDALAVAVMHRRGFDAESLAFVHAGGVIGRQAALHVADLMHRGPDLPVVDETVTLREALVEIFHKRLGMTTLVDAQGLLAGVLTDGDLKRILLSPEGEGALARPVSRFMTRTPRTIDPGAAVAAAVRLMEDPERGPITSLVVIGGDRKPLGVIHLHDCLRPA
jgi:arabinose-5-phosphate isomerase